MKGWRYELFGVEVERLKRGELGLRIDRGEVVSVEMDAAGSKAANKARAAP